MNTLLISRLFRNGMWFSLALVCSVLPAAYFSGGAPVLSVLEIGVLALVTLSSTLVVELIGVREEQKNSTVRQTLAAMPATASMLFLLSLVPGLFVPHLHIVLAVLLLFSLFRCLSSDGMGLLKFPSFLSTGVVLLGNGPSAKTVRELIENSNGRYTLRGAIAYGAEDAADESQNTEELLIRACKTGVGRLVVSFPERRGTMPVIDIMRCRMRGIAVMDVPSFYESVTRKLYIETITPSWFIFSAGFRLSYIRRFVKRAFDLFFAIIGLCLLLPLFPLLALAIRLDSPGPVFFRQIRTGLGGQPFHVIKLRTMRADAEQQTGAVWASKRDPRVTRLGRFLRKTRLDEVPQLINVLCGDMSLIGPRPERPEFIHELERQIPFYSERHTVKPGVTGWAQVRYPYGSSVEDALEKLRYDLYYIKNQSFLLDGEIVLRTIAVVLLGSGAR